MVLLTLKVISSVMKEDVPYQVTLTPNIVMVLVLTLSSWSEKVQLDICLVWETCKIQTPQTGFHVGAHYQIWWE